MDATTGWTEGKLWDSLGRAPLGRSEMEATTGWTEGKPWEIAWGELRWEGRSRGDSSVGKERDGSDDRVDGRETVGNSLERAPLGRSEMEATTGWTEGLGESSVGKERGGSDDKPDRGEAVGNSLGRAGAMQGGRRGNRREIAWGAPVGRSEMEATTGWMEGEPQGITWESSVGNDMGNSLGRAPGRAPLGGKETEAAAGWTEGKPWETAWGELRWERAESSVGKERYGSDIRVDGGANRGK